MIVICLRAYRGYGKLNCALLTNTPNMIQLNGALSKFLNRNYGNKSSACASLQEGQEETLSLYSVGLIRGAG